MQAQVVPVVTYAAVVGKVIARRRDLLRLDQAHLAQALGVAQSTWSRLENGAVALDVEQLRIIATALKMTPEAVLQEADQAVAFLRQRGVQVASKQDDNAKDGLLAFLGGAALLTLIIAALTNK